MNPADALLSSRLARLLSYLEQDPANPALLAEACDAALEAGAYDCARECLATADDMQLSSPEWAGRAAHLSIETARELLRSGDAVRSREELSTRMAGTALDAGTQDAIHILWLRATHASGLAGEAAEWARARQEQAGLHPAAAGVASLAAVDVGDFPLAKRLADKAMQQGAQIPEALVARASVALAERDNPGAMHLLRQAQANNPQDGRTLSTLGMAHLQAGDFAAALQHFDAALRRMPAHIGSWHGLGWACLLHGDQARAAAAFRQALALDRNFAESHGAVALMSIVEGRAEEARHHLDLADRLDRHSVTAGYARAFQTGEVRDAEALRSLASRLLDRPGLFGGRMHEDLAAQHDRHLRRGPESL